jgi:hypothetical protein
MCMFSSSLCCPWAFYSSLHVLTPKMSIRQQPLLSWEMSGLQKLQAACAASGRICLREPVLC